MNLKSNDYAVMIAAIEVNYKSMNHFREYKTSNFNMSEEEFEDKLYTETYTPTFYYRLLDLNKYFLEYGFFGHLLILQNYAEDNDICLEVFNR